MAALRVSWPWALALALASTVVALLAGRLPGVHNAENTAYDLRLTSFSPPPTREKDIVILGVDDATVQGLRSNESYARAWGNWPYARSLWARVLTHLETMGARAVVLDFTMDEQSTDRGQDALLREAIAQLHIPVALGYAVNVPSQNGDPLPAVRPQNWTVQHRVPRPRLKSGDPFAPVEGTEAPPTPELVASVLAFPVQSGRSLPDLAVDLPGAPRTMRHPVQPVGPLLDVVPALGLVYPEPDPDGKLRRTRFAYTDGANRYVTLAVALAADLLGAEALAAHAGHRCGRERRARLRRHARAAVRRPQPPRGGGRLRPPRAWRGSAPRPRLLPGQGGAHRRLRRGHLRHEGHSVRQRHGRSGEARDRAGCAARRPVHHPGTVRRLGGAGLPRRARIRAAHPRHAERLGRGPLAAARPRAALHRNGLAPRPRQAARGAGGSRARRLHRQSRRSRGEPPLRRPGARPGEGDVQPVPLTTGGR